MTSVIDITGGFETNGSRYSPVHLSQQGMCYATSPTRQRATVVMNPPWTRPVSQPISWKELWSTLWIYSGSIIRGASGCGLKTSGRSQFSVISGHVAIGSESVIDTHGGPMEKTYMWCLTSSEVCYVSSARNIYLCARWYTFSVLPCGHAFHRDSMPWTCSGSVIWGDSGCGLNTSGRSQLSGGASQSEVSQLPFNNHGGPMRKRRASRPCDVASSEVCVICTELFFFFCADDTRSLSSHVDTPSTVIDYAVYSSTHEPNVPTGFVTWSRHACDWNWAKAQSKSRPVVMVLSMS